jgi:hypothetical protein
MIPPDDVLRNVTVSPTEMFNVGGENVRLLIIATTSSPLPSGSVGRSEVHAATADTAIAANASRRFINFAFLDSIFLTPPP